MDTILMKINGRELEVPKGKTILQACQLHGIKVPTLCYDEDLRAVGSCRICVVEAVGRPMMLAACVTPAEANMDILTDSEAVRKARRINLELMSASHQFNCQVCEKNADCRLQDYCYEYGVDTEKYAAGRHQIPINDPNPFIKRDYNKCIMCTCCVRACEEMVTANAIDVELRGFHSQIACAFDEPLAKSSCIFCGQCIMVCPVGALTSKVAAGRGRSYETDKTMSTCAFCSTGCAIKVDSFKGEVAGIGSLRDSEYSPVNQGMLCGKGRFGWDFATAKNRVGMPLCNGEKCDWDDALGKAATLLKANEKTGFLISSHSTNEELTAATAFANAAKFKYFDTTSPLSQQVIMPLIEATGLVSGTTNLAEMDQTTSVFLVAGADAWLSHPVIAMKISQKVLTGKAKLIVVDSRKTVLAKKANVFIQCQVGQEAEVINQIAAALLADGKCDDLAEGYTSYCQSLPKQFSNDAKIAADLVTEGSAVAFLYGGDVGPSTQLLGRAVCNLALATGNFDKPGAGILPLVPANNGVGAAIVGAAAFGSESGILAMLESAAAGQLDTLLILGENPKPYGVSDDLWNDALRGVKNLVIEEMFADSYVDYSVIILPGLSYLEKEGTFVNCEGRVQSLNSSIKDFGQARDTINIITGLAEKLKIAFAVDAKVDIDQFAKKLRTKKLIPSDAPVAGVFPPYDPGMCPGFFYHNGGMTDCSLSFKFKKSEV